MTMHYYFAPMEGVTSYLYRRAHHQCFPGVDKYFMPFFATNQDHVFPRRALQDILPAHNEGIPAVPQLLTRRAEDFIWAAGELAAMGYREVNLNLGCPSGTVAAKGKGAGFLAFPEELDCFLGEIFSRVEMKISIKTRLGIREPEEFERLLEIYRRYPVAELTIHPRVQKDFYRNHARRAWFGRALQAGGGPLCYNGDLVTAQDCRGLQAQFPALEAVMLGRGLVASPDLVTRLKGGPAAGKADLRSFHDQLYHSHCVGFGSDRSAMLRMKEIWFYLIHRFRDGERYAKQLRKATDTRVFESVVAAIFRDLELLEEANGGYLG